MLTADLVRATKKGDVLHVKPLAGKTRERAVELAEQYWQIARDLVGMSRDALDEEWAAVATSPQEKKLGEGLCKLIEDECDFGEASELEPRELRSEVFLRAAAAWHTLAPGTQFSREVVVQEVASERSLSPELIERSLYADLKGAQRLNVVPERSAEWLVTRYNEAQVQAVLLRAVRVRATVRCRSVDAQRSLFRSLKFRRLLYKIEAHADGSYVIDIDGPYSLFDNVTKYGLQLALVLPALQRADQLELAAEVRWGKTRKALTFNWEQKRPAGELELENRLPDELVELIAGFHNLNSGWKVKAATALVNLPGVGLCVPDLEFVSPEGIKILFELMGFWSRDAVWQRVELVKKGLKERLLFGVSSRLRVSEKVLKDEDHAGLYVYKGVMSPRALLKHLEQLL